MFSFNKTLAAVLLHSKAGGNMSKREITDTKKKFYSLILTAVAIILSTMLVSSCTSEQPVADPIAESDSDVSTKQNKSSNYIQSLEEYSDENLAYGGESDHGTYINYKMSGNKDDVEVVEKYVDCLCSGDMNLELVDTFEQQLGNQLFFSYAIDYVGKAKVSETCSMQYNDKVESTICVWAICEKDKLTVNVYVPASIEVVDLGYRYEGGTVDISAAGESVYEGLYKNGNSYETADGRLKTKLGKAMILRDGKEIVSDAEYVITGKTKEELKVYNYYRTESLYFTAQYNKLEAGDIYDMKDLRRNHNDSNPESFSLGTAFAMRRDDEWIYPLTSNSEFENLSVRVMYYEKNVAAVFYIYAEFIDKPYTIETLCAVDLTSEQVQENNDSDSLGSSSSEGSVSYSNIKNEKCTYCNGTGTRACLTCNGKGYLETTVTTPKYSGASSSGGTKTTTKSCSNILCSNGQVECSFCGGTGYR